MAKWCIGIDLGGTFVKFLALDDQRRPREPLQLPTPSDRDGMVRLMIDGARQLTESQHISPDDVIGVGVGSPGPLNLRDGIMIAAPNLPGMENLPIRDLISAGLKRPAVLENDANAAALGEYLCGAGKGTSVLVMLTLGTGVGGGIVIDGRILHGAHGVGAELGHIIVQPGGEPCGCGQRGCLERYSSATYIAQLATRRIEQDGRDSSLKTVLADKGAIDAKDINAARNSGDALAEEIWDQAMRYLAQGCITICRIFDPDKIVLGGGLIKAGDDLMTPLRKHFRDMDWKLTEPLTELVLAELGNDAGAIGAAGVAWDAFG